MTYKWEGLIRRSDSTYQRRTDDLLVDRSHIRDPVSAKQLDNLTSIGREMVPLKDCTVALPLGYYCPESMRPIEVRHGIKKMSYRVKTALGWSVIGQLGTTLPWHKSAFRTIAKEVPPTNAMILERLEEKVEQRTHGQKMSLNDRRFLEIMESNISIEDGYYTMPLPFKNQPTLAPNKKQAWYRLKSLKRFSDDESTMKPATHLWKLWLRMAKRLTQRMEVKVNGIYHTMEYIIPRNRIS